MTTEMKTMRWMTKTTMGVLLAMAVAAAGPEAANAQDGIDAVPPEGWSQEDPAARAYQAAREALTRRQFAEAADRFAAIRDEYRNSVYRADSYYWEAFSLSREGSRRSLETALRLLAEQRAEYAEARTRADADELAVRIEAQLARRGDPSAAEAIVRRAGEAEACDGDAGLRSAALSALMNMNSEQAIPILEEILSARDETDECATELRRRAVFLIAQHVTPETVDILLDLAHRRPDPDREVREQAVFWLHQVEGEEALDALQAILAESDDPEIQEKAIFAISQRSDPRSQRILQSYAERDDVPDELRRNAIFWLGQSGRNGGAPYIIALYEQLDSEELKESAIFAIGQTRSEEARRWLLARAMDRGEDIEVRKNALFWAGQTGAISADRLAPFYESVQDTEMKEQVIFVASQMREAEAVDFLMDVARNEEDEELQKKAVFWLGQSKDPRVPEFLLELLRMGRRVR